MRFRMRAWMDRVKGTHDRVEKRKKKESIKKNRKLFSISYQQLRDNRVTTARIRV